MEKPAYMHAQTEALRIISDWARKEKTPIPKKELFKGLVLADISESTARKSIASLVKKGNIRRAIISSNQSFYVLVKSIL